MEHEPGHTPPSAPPVPDAPMKGAQGALPPADRTARVLGVFKDMGRELLEKVKDVGGTNLALGHYHFERGNIRDAWFRFLIVTTLNPRHAEGLYMLARSQDRLGRRNKARATIARLLAIAPQHMHARALLEEWKQAEKPAAASSQAAPPPQG